MKTTKTILVGLVATVSLSVSAQIVKPRTTVVKPGTTLEVKPGTTLRVETQLQGQTGLSLDAFKAAQPGAAAAVVNEQALNTLNAEEQCGSAYVANKFVAAAPKLVASDIQAAVEQGILKPGNCGEGSILSVQNPQVIENVGQTTSCVLRGGGKSLSGDTLDTVGGGCLLQAKADDVDAVATDAPTEINNYRVVGQKCGWWAVGGNTTIH